MREPAPVRSPLVGIIANPVSARDIRRVIANANSLQLADRVNIVLRLLSALAAGGVGRVLMMPDREGLRAMLQRHLARSFGRDATLAAVDYLNMAVTGSVDDTLCAARMMREAGVAAIVVLGGDGTHRAVVRECGDVPIVGLSTGTNNAFPEMREPTITGLATALFASGRIPARCALVSNKRLEVTIREPNGAVHTDIALVDAVISREQYIGARAVWKTDMLTAVYVSYASPQAIGLSAIAGLLEPVGRHERGGLAIELGRHGQCAFELMAPIAPGLMRSVPVACWHRLEHAVPERVQHGAGIVALDGERELAFDKDDEVFMTLQENAFSSIDVAACMSYAADAHLMRRAAGAALSDPEFRLFTPQT